MTKGIPDATMIVRDTERNMIQEEKNRGYLNRGYIRDHMDGLRRRKR